MLSTEHSKRHATLLRSPAESPFPSPAHPHGFPNRALTNPSLSPPLFVVLFQVLSFTNPSICANVCSLQELLEERANFIEAISRCKLHW